MPLHVICQILHLLCCYTKCLGRVLPDRWHYFVVKIFDKVRRFFFQLFSGLADRLTHPGSGCLDLTVEIIHECNPLAANA